MHRAGLFIGDGRQPMIKLNGLGRFMRWGDST